MASTAYSRDYRDWIAGGNFERVCERGREDVAGAINFQRPDLLAPALRDIAVAYYIRGAVCLMDGDPLGLSAAVRNCTSMAATFQPPTNDVTEKRPRYFRLFTRQTGSILAAITVQSLAAANTRVA